MGSSVFKTVEGCWKSGPGGFDSHPLPSEKKEVHCTSFYSFRARVAEAIVFVMSVFGFGYGFALTGQVQDIY